jgi:hypothetical protein
MGFWQRWASRLQSSGMWRRVIWYRGTNILQESAPLHLQGRILCRAVLLWDVRFSRQHKNYTSFWDGVPYSLVERHQRSERTCCVHLQGRWVLPSPHSITTQDARPTGSLRQMWRRVVKETKFVLPERWTLQTLPKLRYCIHVPNYTASHPRSMQSSLMCYDDPVNKTHETSNWKLENISSKIFPAGWR